MDARPCRFRPHPHFPMSTSLLRDAHAPSTRREFFKRAGFGLGAVAVAGSLQACDSDGEGGGDAVTLDFSNDFGVLNYAYALEQLEYAFYEAVLAGGYFRGLGTSSEERQILQDLRDHELAHVDFFNAALGNNAIGELSVDFGSIDFTSRASVLGAARAFEDTGVSAYNGAGQYLESTDFLTVAGKIVSVEARHAAAIRDLLQPGTAAFAGDDVVDPATGLDVVRTPAQVLQVIDQYVVTPVSVINVPS